MVLWIGRWDLFDRLSISLRKQLLLVIWDDLSGVCSTNSPQKPKIISLKFCWTGPFVSQLRGPLTVNHLDERSRSLEIAYTPELIACIRFSSNPKIWTWHLCRDVIIKDCYRGNFYAQLLSPFWLQNSYMRRWKVDKFSFLRYNNALSFPFLGLDCNLKLLYFIQVDRFTSCNFVVYKSCYGVKLKNLKRSERQNWSRKIEKQKLWVVGD